MGKKRLVKKSNRLKKKKKFDESFADSLSKSVSPVKEENFNLVLKEMFVLHNKHNKMIISQYIINKNEHKKAPPSPDIIRDSNIEKDILHEANIIAETIKSELRKKILPFIIGYESADTDLQEDIKVILNKKSASLESYRKITRDVMQTYLSTYFSNMFDLDKNNINDIIAKNLLGKDNVTTRQNKQKR